MISYFIEVTICWAGFYGLYALLLSKTTFFRANRYYLIGTMLLGLLAPLMNLPTFAPEPESIPGVAYLHPVTVGAQQLEVVVTAGAEDPGFNYYRLLQWIYLGGLLLFGSRFLYGLWQIRQLYREGRKEKYEGYTLVRTRKPHLPFSFFGYLFWSERIDLEGEDGKAVLRHEQAHISDRHSFDVLLMEILCLTFWFSPFVYLYRRSLRTVHEYLADHVVLQTTRRKKYGHLLLKQSQSGLQVALANHFFQHQIKKRIMMMTRHKTSRKALLRYFLAVPLFILFLLAFANRQLIGQTLLEIHKPDGTVELHTLKTAKEADQYVSPEQIATVEVLKKEDTDKIIIRMKDEAQVSSDAIEGGESQVIIRGWEEYQRPLQVELVHPDGRMEKLSGAKEEQMNQLSEIVQPSDIARIEVRKDEEAETDRLTVYLKGADEEPAAPSPDGASTLIKVEETEKQAMQTDPEAYKVVEQMPLFPGCEDIDDAGKRQECSNREMILYIYKNIQYPEAARKAKIEGTVIVKFIVDKTGQVTGAKVVRDIGGGAGEEVLGIVNDMPRWTPGEHKGEKVNVELVIPVKFKLSEKEKQQAADRQLKLQQFSASPNPTGGQLQLRFQGEAAPTQLRISDLSGREIFQQNLQDFDGYYTGDIDLSKASGTLLLTIQQGERLFTEKIIVQ